jgi:DNA modification methylase
MASGEMTEKQYASFLLTAVERVRAVLNENALAYICIDWRSAGLLDGIARRCFRKPVNWVTWVKDAAGQGSFLRSRHEFVLIYCNGDGPFLNNVQLGRYGRNRSNVWNYPGVVGFNRERRAELAQHPTPKPVALVRDAIFDCTKPAGIVLDTFLGGGATLMACERSGRICRGLELAPAYVDVCVRRWQSETGRRAVCADTGATFDEVAASMPGALLMLSPPSKLADAL